MGKMVSMRQAALQHHVDRATIAKWVKSGRLTRTKKKMVGAIRWTFVDSDEVKREAAKIRAGRPRKAGRP